MSLSCVANFKAVNQSNNTRKLTLKTWFTWGGWGKHVKNGLSNKLQRKTALVYNLVSFIITITDWLENDRSSFIRQSDITVLYEIAWFIELGNFSKRLNGFQIQ